ncbi:pupal cuticle protein 27-like [Aphomia sociella]
MKLFTTIVASAIIGLTSAGQLYMPQNFASSAETYQPTQQYHQQGLYSQPQGFTPAPDAYVQSGQEGSQSAEKNARILSYNAENHGHSYQYSYETDNGIQAQESGQIDKGTQAHGAYSYKGDDGQIYTVTYTADENGFRPQGSHLPTPPPIPEAIAKAIEQNAQEAADGILDDGSYKTQSTGQDYQQQNDAGYQQNRQQNDHQQNGYQQSGYQQNGYQQNGYQQNGYQQSRYQHNGNQQNVNQQRSYAQNNYQQDYQQNYHAVPVTRRATSHQSCEEVEVRSIKV